MPPYWKRIDIICHRIIAKAQNSSDDEIVFMAASLIQKLVQVNEFEFDSHSKDLLDIYDIASSHIDKEQQGTAWYDLGLHLNRFR